ncbi:hypothetical protein [Amycolatopsis magusensis]|uniref:hypothetical protein n=1 Tax=Amycolatopsis magusensis TaxID=882444 RepID=UPI00379405BA
MTGGHGALPQWTPIHDGPDSELYEDGLYYEATGSDDRTWRLWMVTDTRPDDPFPAGWRLAPVDALDQTNYIQRVGGFREFDQASLRIADRHELRADPLAVRQQLGLGPTPEQTEQAVAVTIGQYGFDPRTARLLVDCVVGGIDG